MTIQTPTQLLISEEQARAYYEQVREERQRRRLAKQGITTAAERERCANDVHYWWNTYLRAYDPRLIGRRDPVTGTKLSPFVPFKLWPKQVELVDWINWLIDIQDEGLLEKSRDTGASYCTCGVALHRWQFDEGFKATFGSRKLDFVDKADNMDALFPKIRDLMRSQPSWLMPRGWNPAKHDKHLQLTNPENGALITGEGGKEMGRGGRSTIYVVDEGAFLENADDTEAALAGNTDCVLWVSSVNGAGNLFYRKRFNVLPPERIFTLHYRDDPRKTKEWAAKKKASMTDPAKWASEYEIDYHASLEGVAIPAKWVRAAQEIEGLLAEVNQVLPVPLDGVTGLDVGAGKAKSVNINRHGPKVSLVAAQGSPDTTETAFWGLELAKAGRCTLLNFDAPGVGAGVASTLQRASDREGQALGLKVQAVNTGVPASKTREWPDGRTSDMTFGNLKAEIWWLCRERFKRTFETVRYLKIALGLEEPVDGDDSGQLHSLSDLISLPSQGVEAAQLAAELSLVRWFRNEVGKIVIETKVQLTKRGIKSPDYADALVLTFVDPPYEFEWYVGS